MRLNSQQFFTFYMIAKSLLFLFLQTQVITPLPRNFIKGRREQIRFKFFSEYEKRQSSTWRELFATQFALQSFGPKMRNKSVCQETDNQAASLTVISKSNKAPGSLDLLGIQSYIASKNIQKSRDSWHLSGPQLHSSLFLQSYASKELISQ